MKERVERLCLSKKTYHGYEWTDQPHSNGKRAVWGVVDRDLEKLSALSDEELKKVLDKVYQQNYKNDKCFRGVYGPYTDPNVYNLNY